MGEVQPRLNKHRAVKRGLQSHDFFFFLLSWTSLKFFLYVFVQRFLPKHKEFEQKKKKN